MIPNTFTNICIAIAAVSIPTPTSTIDELNASKIGVRLAAFKRVAVATNNINAPATTTAALPIESHLILENAWKEADNINNDVDNNNTPPEIPAISFKISIPDFPTAVSPASSPNTDSNTEVSPNVAVKILCHGTVASAAIDIPKATNNKATPESCNNISFPFCMSILFNIANTPVIEYKNPTNKPVYIALEV